MFLHFLSIPFWYYQKGAYLFSLLSPLSIPYLVAYRKKLHLFPSPSLSDNMYSVFSFLPPLLILPENCILFPLFSPLNIPTNVSHSCSSPLPQNHVMYVHILYSNYPVYMYMYLALHSLSLVGITRKPYFYLPHLTSPLGINHDKLSH